MRCLRSLLISLLLVALVLGQTACRRPAAEAQPTAPAAAPALHMGEPYAFPKEKSFSVSLAAQPKFTPKVKDYHVNSNLSNISNLKLFKSELRPEHLAAIAKNGFVVVPATWKQMEFVYELNTYPHEHRPSFVTTDSMLHTFHVFYDYMLRTIEVTTLYERLSNLSLGLLQGAAARYGALTDASLNEAARYNFAFAVVPAKLLEIPADKWGVTVPPDVSQLADQELALIEAHGGFAASPTVFFDVDYSQFIPRGHYTRSEKLKRYFKAMMWYGLVPMAMRDLKKNELSPRTARQAYLMAQSVVYDQYNGVPLGKLWQDVYEPTAFLVGFADDNTPADFTTSAAKLFGNAKDTAPLLQDPNLTKLADAVLALRPPQIIPVSVQGITNLPGNPQLRVMGQRFVLDSYLFQKMVFPFVGNSGQDADPNHPGTFNIRTFPMGLDVMSILGSQRAYEIADKTYEQTRFKNYEQQTQALRAEVGKYSDADWTKNVYAGWLHTFTFLLQPKGPGYPAFMRQDAWLDKQLNCALASWAELRHDTILYAKQSVVAECGGDGGEKNPPPKPKGYVEPEVLTYWRLGLLLRQLRDGLNSRKLLADEDLQSKFDDFLSSLKFLQDVSVKELTNVPLNRQEFDTIEYFGDTLAHLNLFMQTSGENSEITSSADQDMAVVADVHTGPIGTESYALEEGVGHANEIFVVYPMNGKLLLGRGAVFSYYEFTVPVANRLTDEEWQKKLDSPDKPKPPKWTSSFRSSVTFKGKRDVEEGGKPAFSTGGC